MTTDNPNLIQDAEELINYLEGMSYSAAIDRAPDVIRSLITHAQRLDARCDRDDKLIFEMKDEISQLKQTVNNLRQKVKPPTDTGGE